MVKKDIGRDYLLQEIVLLKLVGRHIVVILSFGQKPVDCVTLGNGECDHLFMFFIFDSSCRQSNIEKREQGTQQEHLMNT